VKNQVCGLFLHLMALNPMHLNFKQGILLLNNKVRCYGPLSPLYARPLLAFFVFRQVVRSTTLEALVEAEVFFDALAFFDDSAFWAASKAALQLALNVAQISLLTLVRRLTLPSSHMCARAFSLRHCSCMKTGSVSGTNFTCGQLANNCFCHK
jgi:hypothetical protein